MSLHPLHSCAAFRCLFSLLWSFSFVSSWSASWLSVPMGERSPSLLSWGWWWVTPMITGQRSHRRNTTLWSRSWLPEVADIFCICFRGKIHWENFHSPSLSTGTEILTVQAADNDDPKTDNVRIFYRLVGQIPESPRALFRVDRDSGVISVQADSMEGTAPQYTLTITAEDAKGDFNDNSIRNLWFNNRVLIMLWLSCLRGRTVTVLLLLQWEQQKFRDKNNLI